MKNKTWVIFIAILGGFLFFWCNSRCNHPEIINFKQSSFDTQDELLNLYISQRMNMISVFYATNGKKHEELKKIMRYYRTDSIKNLTLIQNDVEESDFKAKYCYIESVLEKFQAIALSNCNPINKQEIENAVLKQNQDSLDYLNDKQTLVLWARKRKADIHEIAHLCVVGLP